MANPPPASPRQDGSHWFGSTPFKKIFVGNDNAYEAKYPYSDEENIHLRNAVYNQMAEVLHRGRLYLN